MNILFDDFLCKFQSAVPGITIPGVPVRSAPEIQSKRREVMLRAAMLTMPVTESAKFRMLNTLHAVSGLTFCFQILAFIKRS